MRASCISRPVGRDAVYMFDVEGECDSDCGVFSTLPTYALNGLTTRHDVDYAIEREVVGVGDHRYVTLLSLAN